ncbi:MAG TPA: rhomboid family intramembrane serine protease [Flavobacteriales bacterium]|nr:rhomboid family intramembrane serine protease [Flavobacteriales bacterium]
MPDSDPQLEVPAVRNRMATALVLPAVVAILLWCIWLLDHGLQLDLTRYGLYPREVKGLLGIASAPLLHGDWEHIFNNSTAVLMLGWCLMYFYPRLAGRVVGLTWFLGGIGVWLIGREGPPHVGASGVIYGMVAFLFTSGMLRGQRTLMALSLLVAFLYGSLVWGIFPIVAGMSWESHLCGAFVGLVLALVYRAVPPAVSDPRPAFLDEDDDEEPPAPYLEDDAGDAVNERELAWKRKLAERAGRPGNVSTTWDTD